MCIRDRFKPLPNPIQNEFVEEPIEHEDGWVQPLTAPGLGIQVQEKFVESIRY